MTALKRTDPTKSVLVDFDTADEESLSPPSSSEYKGRSLVHHQEDSIGTEDNLDFFMVDNPQYDGPGSLLRRESLHCHSHTPIKFKNPTFLYDMEEEHPQ